jgi:hypothetical protein
MSRCTPRRRRICPGRAAGDADAGPGYRAILPSCRPAPRARPRCRVAVDRGWLADRLATARRLGDDGRKSRITFGVADIGYPIFAFDRISDRLGYQHE